MKNIILSSILASSLLVTNVNANLVETSKGYINKAMFWKDKPLKKISFEKVYPKAFYKKSYFSLVVIGSSIVAAGAITYFTAGAGAPAAATGVSSIASTVAGGGAGSYMAGLSTIGGWFGGNAILGASILNGISLGTIGGGASFSALSTIGKLAVMANVTAFSLDGVLYFQNDATKNMEYKIKMSIPKNLGSKETKYIVDKIYEIEEESNEVIEEITNIENEIKEIKYSKKETSKLNDLENKLLDLNNRLETRKKQKITLYKNAIERLEYILQKSNINKKLNQDLIVLGIIANNNSKVELFDKALNMIDKTDLENKGFIYYLEALQQLNKGNIKTTLQKLDNAKSENKYSIEPIILYINIIGNDDFIKNEPKILQLVKDAEENFDTDDYSTPYSMTSLYYRVGTFYFNSKRYVQAEKYYEKAYKELGMIESHFSAPLVNEIKLQIANSQYLQDKKEKSKETFKEIIDSCEDYEVDLKEYYKKRFGGYKK